MARETWYVLEDGTAVHPSEVSPNEDGRLAHKSGLVDMRPDGETPWSTGVDVDDDAVKTEVMKPSRKPAAARKPGYKTRKV